MRDATQAKARQRRRRAGRGLGLFALGLQLSGCGLLLGLPELESKRDPISQGGQGGQGGHVEPSSGGQPHTGGAEPLGGLGGLGGTATYGVGGSEPVCADPCDCDDDGHDATGICGGDDCDDDDDIVHPGQLNFFIEAAKHAHVGFDYDCNGDLDRDPTQGGETPVNCNVLVLGDCTGRPQGFKALPACGAKGSWSACQLVQPLGLSCAAYEADPNARARCH